jgi:hypothetical protein
MSIQCDVVPLRAMPERHRNLFFSTTPSPSFF